MRRTVFYVLTCLLLLSIQAQAQTQTGMKRVEILPYGDMEKWIVRTAKESAIIGGELKTLYEIGEPVKMEENEYYTDYNGSVWATSSVIADVGVRKTSVTVFPEKRETGGYCARLETRSETVKVLGLVNINVIATGTIFLGTIDEPIRNVSDPDAKLVRGVPIDKKPKAVVFDYKMRCVDKRQLSNGWRTKNLGGLDSAEVVCMVQKRWEDANGNLYAERIGSAFHRFRDTSGKWTNGYQVPIIYGEDQKKLPHTREIRLQDAENGYVFAKNSRGEIKRVVEVGYASPDEKPTHVMMYISSGYGGAYVGSPGSMLWVDNAGFGY